ncbi:hypothetical protein HDF26_000237 [Pedobacter cryoconitis]|uniref:hypothetical protein n=1 Tax=Pedobacter cryoconitis TaxID=188932 RepID=UPI00160F202F|nr:hypothetical protein [Pedobacter cryoconitis]MBB6269810.1 hypothetical protein [Pedobacter cryoconitis]
MLAINIFTKVLKYIGILTGMTIPYCNHAVKTTDTVNPSAIVVPKIDPGNTARYITLEMDMNKGLHPSFYFTDLPFDKNKGLMLMKDDALLSDYTVVFKILSGGIVNGKRYPGFYYTDGTGKNINYKYSFAINANEGHTTDTNNAASWAQINEILAKGHAYMNHSMFHGGTDLFKAIKDSEKNMWAHTHYRMTEIVPPGNDEGYVENGLQLGYHMMSSEFGEPVPDGNNSPGKQNVSWGSYIPMLTQNFNRVLISRTNLGDQWNTAELKTSKAYIDYIFNHPEKDKKLVGAAFSHGPFGDKKEGADNFFGFLMYIKHHPANHDSAWITSSKELMDYENTKAKVVISSEHYDPQTGKYKIVLDMNRVDSNVIYRNLSLKVKGGTIGNVKADGVNEVTFNPSTGLINLYKTDRSKVINPFKDPLPPQIVSITTKGNVIFFNYDKPVVQTKKQGYEIPGNKILELKGAGKEWQLVLQNPVGSAQTFFYRIQLGDAKQTNNPLLRVCSYIGQPIKH